MMLELGSFVQCVPTARWTWCSCYIPLETMPTMQRSSGGSWRGWCLHSGLLVHRLPRCGSKDRQTPLSLPPPLQVPHQPTTPNPLGVQVLLAPPQAPDHLTCWVTPILPSLQTPIISRSELVIPPVSFSLDSENPVLFLHSPHALCLPPPRLACCPTVTGPPHYSL